jgi:hypothetical protein
MNKVVRLENEFVQIAYGIVQDKHTINCEKSLTCVHTSFLFLSSLKFEPILKTSFTRGDY